MNHLNPQISKIILGIDPGTNVMGYGVLRVTGNKAELVVMGVIDMRKERDSYLRLGKIFDRVTGCTHSRVCSAESENGDNRKWFGLERTGG